jgi:hypothetical protein
MRATLRPALNRSSLLALPEPEVSETASQPVQLSSYRQHQHVGRRGIPALQLVPLRSNTPAAPAAQPPFPSTPQEAPAAQLEQRCVLKAVEAPVQCAYPVTAAALPHAGAMAKDAHSIGTASVAALEVQVWVHISHQGPLTLLKGAQRGHDAAQDQHGTCAVLSARSTAGGNCITKVLAVETVRSSHQAGVPPQLWESRVQVSTARCTCGWVSVNV